MADPKVDIEKAASRPKEAQNDAGRVEQHSLKEQIEADRYLNSKAASKRKTLGVRFTRIKGGTAL